MKSSHPSDVPDSLVEILCTRARYEEGIIAEIKVALAAGDFKLADQMIFEGPGTIPQTIPKQKSGSQRSPSNK